MGSILFRAANVTTSLFAFNPARRYSKQQWTLALASAALSMSLLYIGNHSMTQLFTIVGGLLVYGLLVRPYVLRWRSSQCVLRVRRGVADGAHVFALPLGTAPTRS